MLNINQLTIQRGKHLLHYDYTIKTGEIITIQGRSGAGKSTLLMAIAGFVDTAEGDILWQDKSLLTLSIQQRPVSLLFQEHNLFEHIGVMENLRLGMNSNIGKQIDVSIHEAAEALHIHDLLTRMPTQLSGGQRQRVALLRTLLRPEPLILLDEPFAELDNATRRLASEWVYKESKTRDKTVLIVTHQDEDVGRLADRNWIMS